MSAPVWCTAFFHMVIWGTWDLPDLIITPEEAQPLHLALGLEKRRWRNTAVFLPPQFRRDSASLPFTFPWWKPVLWSHLDAGKEDGDRGENDWEMCSCLGRHLPVLTELRQEREQILVGIELNLPQPPSPQRLKPGSSPHNSTLMTGLLALTLLTSISFTRILWELPDLFHTT